MDQELREAERRVAAGDLGAFPELMRGLARAGRRLEGAETLVLWEGELTGTGEAAPTFEKDASVRAIAVIEPRRGNWGDPRVDVWASVVGSRGPGWATGVGFGLTGIPEWIQRLRSVPRLIQKPRTKRNTDDRLRAAERAAAAGDPAAKKQLHVERRRAGLPLLPDSTSAGKRWQTESFYFPNGRGVFIASALMSTLTPDEETRLDREGRPGRYAQIEWDRNFWGGDYDDVGDFAYLELERPYVNSRGLFAVDRLTDENVEERFEKLTGASRENIVHYTLDETYAKDEDGEFVEEDLADDGIAYVSMGDDRGMAPIAMSRQWPAICIRGSQVGKAHLNPDVQAIVAEVFDMPQWTQVRNPRRNTDEELRALERAWRASPDDPQARRRYAEARRRAGRHREALDVWQDLESARAAGERGGEIEDRINAIWAEAAQALRAAHPRIRRSKRKTAFDLEQWANEVIGEEATSALLLPFRERIMSLNREHSDLTQATVGRLRDVVKITLPEPGDERPWHTYHYGDSPFGESARAAHDNVRIAVAIARRAGISARWTHNAGRSERSWHPPGYVTIGAHYQSYASVAHPVDLQLLDAQVEEFKEARYRELTAINEINESWRKDERDRRFLAWQREGDELLREGDADGPEQPPAPRSDGPRCAVCGIALVAGPSRTLPPGTRCQRCPAPTTNPRRAR